jgi:glycine C-acetyltransferase
MGAMAALEVVQTDHGGRQRLWRNAATMRARMEEEGFQILAGDHAIVPVMFSTEHEATAVAQRLFARGVYATAFTYPVVPMGRARIRIQLSSAHTNADIEAAVLAFVDARDARA